MALFETALVALSMTEVFLMDEPQNSLTCRRVHLFLTEYAKNQHALVLSQLADGARLCEDPPKVLYSIMFPSEQLEFKFEQKDLAVTVFARSNDQFCLIFEHSVDFWEMVRIISEAYSVDAIREENVKDLLKKAISSIPTICDFPNGVPA